MRTPRPRTPLALGLLWSLLCTTLLPAARAGAQAAGTPVEAVDAAAIDAAVERGVARLIELQELDGSWHYLCAAYPPGQTALSVFTLLKCGVPVEHQAIQRGLEFLEATPPELVYSTTAVILALQEAGPVRYRGRIAELGEQLEDWQEIGFAYPHGQEDLSNTQYGALGLRAATQTGSSFSPKVWQRLIDFVTRMGVHTRTDVGRGWAYRSDRHESGSMTAAALAVLAIARDELTSRGRLRGKKLAAVNEQIEVGLEWLGKNWSVVTSVAPTSRPGEEVRWRYYYLYGIERACTLLGLDRIAGHDWYAEGARALLEAQNEHGEWNTAPYEVQPNTCFALLFLKRATRPTTGEGDAASSRVRNSYGDDDPGRPASLRAAGDSPLRVWISSFGDAAQERFTWAEDGGRGPRVARVEYVLLDGAGSAAGSDAGSGTVLATVNGEAGKPADGERFAARVELPGPGTWRILARVHVRPPDGDEDATLALETNTIEVRSEERLAPWMLRYAGDGPRNRLAGAKLELEASSVYKQQGWRASNACDGLQTRGWLSAEDDAEPWIRVDLKRAQRGNVVLLSHARDRPTRPGAYARATEVEVEINGRKPIRVTMDPHEQRKTRVELGRTEAVRAIEVRVLGRTPGSELPNAVGLMEIELQLEPD